MVVYFIGVIRHLQREQFIPAEPGRVWDFFATPANLNELTPPSVRFQIIGEIPPGMFAGQIIRYRISPLPGVWLKWVTEISRVDEQRAGPYKIWHHEHRFVPEHRGGRMFDHVIYEVGWGPLGWLAEKLWVARQLQQIFDYRSRRVDEIFNRRG